MSMSLKSALKMSRLAKFSACLVMVAVGYLPIPGEATLSIAGGYSHTCGIAANSKMQCWGQNGSGQIGDGNNAGSSIPLGVSGNIDWLDLGMGHFHSCGLTFTHQVYCWGDNGNGSLGLGNTTDSNIPLVVNGLNSVQQLSIGGDHSCALKQDGTLWCWGSNSYGQMAVAQPLIQKTPLQIQGLEGGVVVAASAGGFHTCARVADGRVWCWGANFSGALGNPDSLGSSSAIPLQVLNLVGTVANLAGGGYHTCALMNSGQIACWGDNESGQLGNGTKTDQVNPGFVTGINDATALTAGDQHTCALRGTTVWCWGGNDYGQLGVGDFRERLNPVAVNLAEPVVALSAGSFHTCAATNSGKFYCWGDHESGQVGNGTTDHHFSPVVVPSWTGAVALAGSYDHMCAITSDVPSKVICVGDNSFGQLGDGTQLQRVQPVITSIPAGTVGMSVATSSFGNGHSCAVVTGGAVKCWGDNGNGQLGDGTHNASSTPVFAQGVVGASVVVAGVAHTCAFGNGTVWCWGANNEGQAGVPGMADQLTPHLVTPLGNVTALAAGDQHTCAVVDNNSVWCWGSNFSGQLGIGNNDGNSAVPVQAIGLGGAKTVAGGWQHTCALNASGQVYCWGRNDFEQLGVPDFSPDPFVPNLVPGIPAMKKLSASGLFNCALTTGGGVWCWGSDSYGEMGDGEPNNSSYKSPQPVPMLQGITDLGIGYRHACAISGATVRCWGMNSRGQLGNGNAGAWAIPQTVVGDSIFSNGFES